MKKFFFGFIFLVSLWNIQCTPRFGTKVFNNCEIKSIHHTSLKTRLESIQVDSIFTFRFSKTLIEFNGEQFDVLNYSHDNTNIQTFYLGKNEKVVIGIDMDRKLVALFYRDNKLFRYSNKR